MITFNIQTERLRELQQRAKESGVSNDVAMAGARAVQNFVKDYLWTLDEERPNKMGGKRSHFLSQAAESVTEPQATGGGAAFQITEAGFAQRLLGGTIRAGAGISSSSGKPTHFLSIPARAETYNTVPSQYHDLVFIPIRGGEAGMLVQAMQSTITKTKTGFKGDREAGGLVMFWLVPEVTQDPDPSLLPSERSMEGAAVDAMESFLTRRIKGE